MLSRGGRGRAREIADPKHQHQQSPGAQFPWGGYGRDIST